MNSVHEQCPNSDSETVLSQKLVKTESGAQCTQLGPAYAHRPRPGRARVAVSWADLAVSWADLAMSWPGPPAVSQHTRVRRAPRPCAPCRGRVAIQPTAKSLLPWSQYTEVYCDTVPASLANMPPLSQYRLLYRDTVFFPFWSQYT